MRRKDSRLRGVTNQQIIDNGVGINVFESRKTLVFIFFFFSFVVYISELNKVNE